LYKNKHSETKDLLIKVLKHCMTFAD